MTVSAEGFSDGTLGATVDENTAAAIAEALLEGASAVVRQVLDINASTPPEQDPSAACNALSSTLTIGGIAEDGAGGAGGGGGMGGEGGAGAIPAYFETSLPRR